VKKRSFASVVVASIVGVGGLVAASSLPVRAQSESAAARVARPAPATTTTTTVVPVSKGLSIYWVGFSTTEQLNALVAGYDVLEAREGNEVQVIADDATIAKIRLAGYSSRLESTLAVSAPTAPSARTAGAASAAAAAVPTFFGGYRTKEEQYVHLDNVLATYPTLTVGHDYGDSWKKANGQGGNDLRVICITKLQPGDCQLNPNSAKPRSLIMASIHARELTPAELAYRYIDMLTTGYGVDPDITAVLDSTEVWVIPIANPDSREIVELGGAAPYLQRKNANNTVGACSNPPTVSNQSGVDLNRNAAYQWGGIGTTTDPCAQTYKGVSAASEPEQQGLQTLWANLWPDQHAVPTDPVPVTAKGTFVSVHSSSNFVLLPPGAGGTSANDAQLRALAFRFSGYNGYKTGTGPEILYGTTGTSDDYVYHELGAASYTFEVGPTSGTCSGFTPAYSCVDSTFWPLNKDAFLYAAKSARQPYVAPRGPSTVTPLATTVVQGASASLTATVNDGLYGNAAGSIGRPAVQNVTSAEYFVDTPPWAGGTAVPLTAADGSFSSSSEAVTAAIPTAGLSVGRHLVWVRGTNAAGFAGPFTAAFLDVTAPLATTTTTVPVTTTTAPVTTTTVPATTTTTTTTVPVTTTTVPATTTTTTVPVTTTTVPATTTTTVPVTTTTIRVTTTTTTIAATTTTTVPVTTTTRVPVTTTTVPTTTTTVPVTTTTTTVAVPVPLFSDNFASGASNWTPVAGTWSIVTDGTARYQGISSTTGLSLSVAGSSAWTNYGVQAVAKVTQRSSANGGFGIFLRYTNTTNYYRLNWNRTSSRWEIVRNQGGTLTTLASSAVSTLPLNTDVTLLAEAIGTTLRLSVDGVTVATATDSAFASGRFGVSTSAARARFDGVVVTPR
jgi:carboxypeptidase T